MAIPPSDYVTEDDYLALDRGSEIKHEYVDRHIYAMTSASSAWRLTEGIGLAASIQLPTINCKLALADVYEKLSLEDNPPVA